MLRYAKLLVIIVIIGSIGIVDGVEIVRKPMYHYRYETEDMMKAGSKQIPIHGYHVVEGGYYPEEVGHHESGYLESAQLESGHLEPIGAPSFMGHAGPRFGKLYTTPIGLGGFDYGFPSHGFHHVQPEIIGYKKHIGGEEQAKEEFNKGGKKHGQEHYEKAEGKKGGEAHKGEEGYEKAAEHHKAEKGDNGYVKEAKGSKEEHEDKKEYHGDKHHKEEGETAKKEEAKKGHKKGHKVKGFKKSHHLDETGKTEEFFDEAHDEGDNFEFKGHQGKFGEGSGSSYKGGNEEKKFSSEEAKKGGHFNQEHASEHRKSNEGAHGAKQFEGNEAAYALSKGGDEHSLLGNQESSKFYKSHPFVVAIKE